MSERDTLKDASVGFAPVAGADARVLILGSLPSEESLRRQQYFARPTNAFWRLMGELVGASPELPYRERCERLERHRIALWDVCRSAVREGSLDAGIDRKTVVPNDFASFLHAHPQIECLCFAGRTAENLFRTLVLPGLPPRLAALPRYGLPSPSAAHAAMRFEEKLSLWKAVLMDYVGPEPSSRSL